MQCKRNTGVWDYDLKNGDRSNNKKSNYQALCPNCHANKYILLIFFSHDYKCNHKQIYTITMSNYLHLKQYIIPFIPQFSISKLSTIPLRMKFCNSKYKGKYKNVIQLITFYLLQIWPYQLLILGL